MTEPRNQWSWEWDEQPPSAETTNGAPSGPNAAPTDWNAPPSDWYAGGPTVSYGSAPPQGPLAPPSPTSYRDQAGPGGPLTPAFTYQPGIVPLRPLSFSEFLDGAFRAIQHNPRVMFGLSLLVLGTIGLVEAALFAPLFGQFLGISASSPSTVNVGGLGALAGGTIVTAVVSLLATVALNGVLVTSVSQSVLGRRASVRAVWEQSKGRFWPLLGLTLLLAVIFAGIMLVDALLTALTIGTIIPATQGDAGGIITALIVSLLVVLAGILLAAFLYVRLALASPALVIERTGVLASIARAWQLSTGFLWRNTGVLLLATLIVGAISGAISVGTGTIVAGVLSVAPGAAWLAGALTVLFSTIVSAVTTPYLAAVTALLYVDIRMRKEGLDVELIRAVGDSL